MKLTDTLHDFSTQIYIYIYICIYIYILRSFNLFCFFKELLVSSRTYLEESETNGDLEVLHPEFNCEADKEMIYDKRKTEASKIERERV